MISIMVDQYQYILNVHEFSLILMKFYITEYWINVAFPVPLHQKLAGYIGDNKNNKGAFAHRRMHEQIKKNKLTNQKHQLVTVTTKTRRGRSRKRTRTNRQKE